MSKSIAQYAHEYAQWEALFLRLYVENAYYSYGENEQAHTNYLLNKFSQYVLKNVRSCYIVLHYTNVSAEAHAVSITMIIPYIQRILYTLCPTLKEITIEIAGTVLTPTQHLDISTEIACRAMTYHHSIPMMLRICMTFDVFCAILHSEDTLQRWSNIVNIQLRDTKRASTVVCCALECTVRNISQLKAYLHNLCKIPKDIQQLMAHLSVYYHANVHPTHIDEIRDCLKVHGMYPYQYWHYARNDNIRYVSHYLETVFLLNSYLGLKLYTGRGKTISWMQGNSAHMSAIGTDTTKNRWEHISPDKEIELRIAQGEFGVVYIPRYIYDRLGNTQVQNAIYAARLEQIRSHFFIKM